MSLAVLLHPCAVPSMSRTQRFCSANLCWLKAKVYMHQGGIHKSLTVFTLLRFKTQSLPVAMVFSSCCMGSGMLLTHFLPWVCLPFQFFTLPVWWGPILAWSQRAGILSLHLDWSSWDTLWDVADICFHCLLQGARKHPINGHLEYKQLSMFCSETPFSCWQKHVGHWFRLAPTGRRKGGGGESAQPGEMLLSVQT